MSESIMPPLNPLLESDSIECPPQRQSHISIKHKRFNVCARF
ncbi:hypothetical protein [Helicobacter cinaedi]|nr:hypothetical protein [Helicobacter cinaedi]